MFSFKETIDTRGWNPQMFQDKSFFEFEKQIILDTLFDFNENDEMSAEDLMSRTTDRMNDDGTFTYWIPDDEKLIFDWSGECGEYLDYWRKNLGYDFPNPFSEPNRFLVNMTTDGVRRICELLLGDKDFSLTIEEKEELIERLERMDEPAVLF